MGALEIRGRIERDSCARRHHSIVNSPAAHATQLTHAPDATASTSESLYLILRQITKQDKNIIPINDPKAVLSPLSPSFA